jgi:hypothetical protein
MVLPFVVAGVGVSMALPAVTTASVSAVPPEHIGRAAGVVNTLRQFGSVFGVAVVAAVFAANGHLGSPASVVDGFRPALAVAAGFSVLGAISGLAVAARSHGLRGTLPQDVPEPVAPVEKAALS